MTSVMCAQSPSWPASPQLLPGSCGELPPALFQEFCRIARDQAGLCLKDGKEALVSARVFRRMRALGLPNFRSYLKYLEADHTGCELVDFLDVITTNFTHFFREPDHFADLRYFILKSIERGQTSFKIWCAASSTGEEPYSLSVTLRKIAEHTPIDYRILATDISTKALNLAQTGIYPEKALEKLAPGERSRYFNRARENDPTQMWFEVKPEIRERVTFDRVNLSSLPFPMKGPLDVIFCRNVMIYLEESVRTQLVGEAERLLRPGGWLVLSHAETLTGIKTRLKVIRPAVYQAP